VRHLLACASSLLCTLHAGGAALAEEGVFESKGVKIRYVAEGKGESVILIHGFSAPSAEMMWVKNPLNEPNVLPTLAKEFRVIAPECRGHGKSGKPHDAKDYGAEMAGDVIRLMDHLKIEKAHVVGYSMGSAIAGKLLADHPDRLLSVTFGGGAPVVEPPKEFKGVIDELATSLEKGEGMGALILRLTPPDGKKLTAEEAAAMGKLALLGQDQKALAAVIRGLPQLEVPAEKLGANKVPVAFIYGSKEAEMLTAQIATARKHLKDAKVAVVEGGDHISTPALPDFRKAQLDFLRANSPRGAKKE
jgi:pimeloyl-ACP methyl ester carboxylesterase